MYIVSQLIQIIRQLIKNSSRWNNKKEKLEQDAWWSVYSIAIMLKYTRHNNLTLEIKIN